LRLCIGPPSERLAGDAGGKTQVILDACGGAGLAAEGSGIEHDRGQPLGRGIHGRSESARPGSDDRDIIGAIAGETSRQTEALADRLLGRRAQHRSIRTNSERQIRLGDSQAGNQLRRIGIRVRIEQGVGDAVATKKILEAQRSRGFRLPEQHQAGAGLDEKYAPQDERARDDLADIAGRDHQPAHLRGIERNDRGTVAPGATLRVRRSARQLADLAAQLAGTVRRDRVHAPECISHQHIECAGEDQEGGRAPLSEIEYDLAGLCASFWAAKASRKLYLCGAQHRKHLLAPAFQERACRFGSHVQSPRDRSTSGRVPCSRRRASGERPRRTASPVAPRSCRSQDGGISARMVSPKGS
jgi:hypothetical protein